jgi:ABC-type transport system involved in cytochrome bd biosynthesis fused ATPase/permease subunit
MKRTPRVAVLALLVSVVLPATLLGCGATETNFEQAEKHVHETQKRMREATARIVQGGNEYNAIARRAWRINHKLQTDRERLAE